MPETTPTTGSNPTNLDDLQRMHDQQMQEQYALMGFQMKQQHDNQMVASATNSQKADHDAMMAVAGNFK